VYSLLAVYLHGTLSVYCIASMHDIGPAASVLPETENFSVIPSNIFLRPLVYPVNFLLG